MARSKLHITSLDDRIVDTLVYVLGTLITVIAAYPLIFVLSASFSEPSSVITGKVVLWPVNFTVEGYKTILEYAGIWTGYRNTISTRLLVPPSTSVLRCLLPMRFPGRISRRAASLPPSSPLPCSSTAVSFPPIWW